MTGNGHEIRTTEDSEYAESSSGLSNNAFVLTFRIVAKIDERYHFMAGRFQLVMNLRSMIIREFGNGFDFEALVIHRFQKAALLVFVDLKTRSQNRVSLLLKNQTHQSVPFHVFRPFRGYTLAIFSGTRTTTGKDLSQADSAQPDLVEFRLRYPPAIAPTTKNGSAPDRTASGSGASGDSNDKSSPQAKNRRNGRRLRVS